MADNVQTPLPDGTTIATDEVAGAHVQLIKVLDAAGGSAVGLAVDANGALRRSMTVASFLAIVSVSQAGGYSAGDVVGTPVDLGTLPPGVIASLEIYLASMAGAALPDLDVFICQVSDATTAGDVGVDGDPLVPIPAAISAALGSNAAGFTPLDFEPAVLRWSTSDPRRITDNSSMDPVRWVAVIRAGATFTDDLTAGLVAVGWGEYVAPSTVEFD